MDEQFVKYLQQKVSSGKQCLLLLYQWQVVLTLKDSYPCSPSTTITKLQIKAYLGRRTLRYGRTDGFGGTCECPLDIFQKEQQTPLPQFWLALHLWPPTQNQKLVHHSCLNFSPSFFLDKQTLLLEKIIPIGYPPSKLSVNEGEKQSDHLPQQMMTCAGLERQTIWIALGETNIFGPWRREMAISFPSQIIGLASGKMAKQVRCSL